MKGIIKPFRNMTIDGKIYRQVRMSSVDNQGRRFEKAKMIGGSINGFI